MRTVIIFSLAILAASSSHASAPPDRYVVLDFDAWKIVYNCTKRGYEWFEYQTVADTGDLPRVTPFHHEERLPEECRQKSTGTYKVQPGSEIRYDRGHGVHQNIWDHSKRLMSQSNSMANIIPQASGLNRRGVWRATEELTECWRDKGGVHVWGGVIWGRKATNDHFIDSHGVVTPDYLWKVVALEDGRVNAWLMPNDDTPQRKRIDDYLVSPNEITRLTGVRFGLPDETMKTAAESSLSRPAGCSLK